MKVAETRIIYFACTIISSCEGLVVTCSVSYYETGGLGSIPGHLFYNVFIIIII